MVSPLQEERVIDRGLDQVQFSLSITAEVSEKEIWEAQDIIDTPQLLEFEAPKL